MPIKIVIKNKAAAIVQENAFVKENKTLESDIKSTFSNAKIEIVKNLGFDLGPFVHVLNEVNLNDYSHYNQGYAVISYHFIKPGKQKT